MILTLGLIVAQLSIQVRTIVSIQLLILLSTLAPKPLPIRWFQLRTQNLNTYVAQEIDLFGGTYYYSEHLTVSAVNQDRSEIYTSGYKGNISLVPLSNNDIDGLLYAAQSDSTKTEL